ncbi:LOW QUALITY PROTEIN: hypothetical protein HZS_3825 [Henneguya salminicola]|nr:LOW QUALITY PROTEIN: hypothetical protein HZS_3825 [Henneguya salminicola]
MKVFFVGGVCITEEECSREIKQSRQMSNKSLPICMKAVKKSILTKILEDESLVLGFLGQLNVINNQMVVTNKKKLYHVERRDANTLLPIISDNVIPGSFLIIYFGELKFAILNYCIKYKCHFQFESKNIYKKNE